MASSDVLKLIASLSSKSSHSELLDARSKVDRNDKKLQNKLAPLEHRAYARESAEADPIRALPLTYMIPAYTISKALGFQPRARSDASIEEMMQGYKGLVEGMINAIGASGDEEDTPSTPSTPNTKVASSK